MKLLRRRTEVNISICCCNNLSRFEIFNKSYFGKLGHEVAISFFSFIHEYETCLSIILHCIVLNNGPPLFYNE